MKFTLLLCPCEIAARILGKLQPLKKQPPMSTNISKQHREDLLNKIQQIRNYIASAPQDTNTENLLLYMDELAKDVEGKKYGLVFEQHREAIDEILKTHTPVLTEQPDLFIDHGGEMNFLIEGDNLAALQLLVKTHKDNIDLIYIDPPYNTGNKDFMYDDCFVDSNDTFRHSKWLSFMEKRLYIARDLLSRKGVIFISIDDNEQAALKMLCDEVFGIDSFVANIIWQKKFSPQNDAKWLSDNHDFVICYAKNKQIWKPKLMKRSAEANSRYKNPDNDPRGDWASTDLAVKTYSAEYDYPITTPSGKVVMPTNGRCWMTSKERMAELIADNRIWFGKNGKNMPRYKTFLSEVKQGIVPLTIWLHNEVGHNQSAKQELKKIFQNVHIPFDTPKPTQLINRILEIAANPSSIILDFFAGSGTTGHAVLKLNADDGGHRKFILCTNNENNICRDVTYERLKTVITGKRRDGSEYNEHYNASLKYYKIGFVPISDKLYYEYADQLLLHIRELVELENGINFNGNNKIAIVLTDEEMEQFVAKVDNSAKILYRGHDVLLSAEQEEYLKAKGIQMNVIPDYYYNELNR